MMVVRPLLPLIAGLAFVIGLGFDVRPSHAQQPLRIEELFPSLIVKGQTNVVHVAIQTREPIQGAELSPAAGAKVSVKQAKQAEYSQGVAWLDVTVDLAADVMPGNRELVLVTPMGRTLPVPLTIASHAPTVSDLKVVSQATASAVDLQFAAADASSDLGDSPYVWFTTSCGDDPVVGVVRGRVSAGIVRASIPKPASPRNGTAAGRCDLQVRTSDTKGIDSNTLKTTVDFRN